MIHLYDEVPGKVDSFGEMFSEGIFYWRLRFNSFGFKWKDEVENDEGEKLREDHIVGAIGGSVIYHSARLNGFSFGAGLYTSQSFGNLDDKESNLYKAGKDTFSRYDALTDESLNLTSLAQAYLEYTHEAFSVKVGRQIVKSHLTKSNDTKMIPNTFEGTTLKSRYIPDTSLQMAYLTRQKLRDHSDFHHLLAVGDDPDDPYAVFTENDDSAMHYGLKLSELQARGIDDRLVIAEVKNESIDDLSLMVNYTAVPDLISTATIQADYRFDLGDMYIIPGLRYMKQFDDGAGEIGGANLKNNTHGYDDPDSLDSELYGARIAFVQDAFKLRFGYTKVADEGDLVAPWRGFPTAGFTRSMAQYNWNANTESYMVQMDYEFESFDELKIISRFAIHDFDDEKYRVQADSKVFTINFFKGLGDSPMYIKTRFAHVIGDDNTIVRNVMIDGELEDVTKPDPSYNELRIELNYLF
ncbi:MAG: outer membrane porin, OprD family [Epsilonproteobacteria bacterium]|nr:MAG: outer membrane porin, OprD family [Campylobacterota bacterium]